MTELSELEINEINRAATFMPEVDEYTTPCLTVGGVQVYAYVGPTGRLIISLDLSDADERLLQPVIVGGNTHMVVPVTFVSDDTTIWES